MIVMRIAVQFGFGWDIYARAWAAVRHGVADMNVLIALGTGTSYCYSLVSILYAMWNASFQAQVLFETGLFLITFVLLGRYAVSVPRSLAHSVSSLYSVRCRVRRAVFWRALQRAGPPRLSRR
jgi:cation transport ATPase